MLKHLDKKQSRVERIYFDSQFWVRIIIVGKPRPKWLELKTSPTTYPHLMTERTECIHVPCSRLTFPTLTQSRDLSPGDGIAESGLGVCTVIIVIKKMAGEHDHKSTYDKQSITETHFMWFYMLSSWEWKLAIIASTKAISKWFHIIKCVDKNLTPREIEILKF